MKRAPIVIGATVAGMAGVLGFHTRPVHTVSLGTTTGAAGTAGGTGNASTATGSAGSGTASTASGSGATAGAASGRSTSAGTRTVNGADEQYRYGELQLRVTVSGGRITGIAPVVDAATDPRSEQINAYAIPQLKQQALAAQSANIDGVSGATYTSEAYATSLQAALDQLGRTS